MISESDSEAECNAVERLVRELPSIAETWRAHRSEWQGEAPVVYLDMGVIAQHLREKLPARPTRNDKPDTSEFSGFFAALEELFHENDYRVRTLLSVGLIESLQNITSSEHGGWSRFETWLGPRTLRAWFAIAAYWEGNPEPLDEVVSGRAFDRD